MNTSSYSFPNMFDVSRNRISIKSDSDSVASRVKLLLLTEPTELYNSPNFGVGLKRYIYQYNSPNIIAQIRDRIIEQLRLWEPSVDASQTEVVEGLISNPNKDINTNELNLTVTIYTVYGEKAQIELAGNELIQNI